ncbi:hypothetical protein HZS_6944 [Henneguya salminicola]|nr:hypothetical protein HZS_6944 [Henneguya salminicola]
MTQRIIFCFFTILCLSSIFSSGHRVSVWIFAKNESELLDQTALLLKTLVKSSKKRQYVYPFYKMTKTLSLLLKLVLVPMRENEAFISTKMALRHYFII